MISENQTEIISLNEKNEFQINDSQLDQMLAEIGSENDKKSIRDELNNTLALLNDEIGRLLDTGLKDFSGEIDVNSESELIALNEIKKGVFDNMTSKLESLLKQGGDLKNDVVLLLLENNILPEKVISNIKLKIQKYNDTPYLMKTAKYGGMMKEAIDSIVSNKKVKEDTMKGV